MRKITLLAVFIFTMFNIFGQQGCVEWKAYYDIPDTCKVLFSDSSQTKISIIDHKMGHVLCRNEVTYYVYQYYLVKSEKTTKYFIGNMGEGSNSYTLTFFEMPNYEKVFTCTKEADMFKPDGYYDNGYFISKHTGCCEYSDYYELSTFPENEKFLSYNKTKFEIHAKSYDRSISEDEYIIYFGYDMCPYYQDSTKTVLGTLNYSINQKINGSVIFKKKNPKDQVGFGGYAPSKVQLMENGEPFDEPADDYRTTIFAHSDNLSFIKNYSEINNLGIIVTFMFYGNDRQSYEKDYKIEFVNGEILQKEIIVE